MGDALLRVSILFLKCWLQYTVENIELTWVVFSYLQPEGWLRNHINILNW